MNYNESEELNRLHFFSLFPCQVGEGSAVQASQFQKGYRNELLLLCLSERGPLPPLSVFQPFLLTFPHLLHPTAIFSHSFSWPLMSVHYPLCLALPPTFCHYTAPSPSPLSMTSSSDFPTGKGKKRKIRDGRQCWMKRKYWQGTKDAENYSEASRRFLEWVGRSVQGGSHPSPLRVQAAVLPARHGFWLP